MTRFGIRDRWPVVCEPFVQWVLEDAFCCGRPAYDDVGVQVVDDVEPYELMKLRMLNAGHQALAYLGVLLGHTYVDEAATDDALRGFVAGYLHDEARPTLPEVPGIDLDDYAAHPAAAFRERQHPRHAGPAGRARLGPHPEVRPAGDPRAGRGPTASCGGPRRS